MCAAAVDQPQLVGLARARVGQAVADDDRLVAAGRPGDLERARPDPVKVVVQRVGLGEDGCGLVGVVVAAAGLATDHEGADRPTAINAAATERARTIRWRFLRWVARSTTESGSSGDSWRVVPISAITLAFSEAGGSTATDAATCDSVSLKPATSGRQTGARRVVGLELGTLAFINCVQRVRRRKLMDVGAAHVATPSSSRNRIIPSRILVLIVPSATPRSTATSR